MAASLAVTALVFGLGLWRHNHPAFWKRGIAAVAVAWAMYLLANAGGTLEDPGGDGLVTHLIREASNDGPIVALWGVVVLIVGYGSIFWLIRRGTKLAAAVKVQH